MAKIFAPTSPAISEREKRNMERVRRIAAEGMVLLENNGILPLKADGRALAVFGNGVRRMVKGGTGSGDVNSRTVVNIEQGLEDAGFSIASKPWLDRFDASCTEYGAQYMADFKAVLQEKGWAGVNSALANPYRDPEVPTITAEDAAEGDRKRQSLHRRAVPRWQLHYLLRAVSGNHPRGRGQNGQDKCVRRQRVRFCADQDHVK